MIISEAPYGSWRSPITPAMAAGGAMRFSDIKVDGDDVYWIEQRPHEGGRFALVRYRDGALEDVLPNVSMRTRVHEYGGGSYAVSSGVVVFSNWEDHRLYRWDGATSVPITPEGPFRYADMAISQGWVYCVREDHTQSPANNELIAVELDGEEIVVVARGRDFYSFPRPNPTGSLIAWTCWDHPNLPWDGTELWLAEVDGPAVTNPRMIAGGESESVFQPEWSPDGVLHFISDPEGWWNIFRYSETTEPVLVAEEEFGGPQWVFGLSQYDFMPDGTIVSASSKRGALRLSLIGPRSGMPDEVTTSLPPTLSPYVRVRGGEVFYLGGSPTHPASIVRLKVDDPQTEVLSAAAQVEIDESHISVPHLIDLTDGDRLGPKVWFYPPVNPGFSPPAGEKPPAIVLVHGGPTSRTRTYLEMDKQFWTSRGFALIDVDYRGSTGYGRAFRDALKQGWGKSDVEDVVDAVRHLADAGEIDPGRVVIRGGSAGGYTVLGALTSTDVFAAGACYFPVASLDTFLDDTHKFEARYLDSLVGPHPEAKDLYEERSPVNFIDQLEAPMVIFQGLDDKITPPSQAEMIVKALEEKGVDHLYMTFEGEGHGFRKLETTVRCLEVELEFFGRVLGFEPA